MVRRILSSLLVLTFLIGILPVMAANTAAFKEDFQEWNPVATETTPIDWSIPPSFTANTVNGFKKFDESYIDTYGTNIMHSMVKNTEADGNVYFTFRKNIPYISTNDIIGGMDIKRELSESETDSKTVFQIRFKYNMTTSIQQAPIMLTYSGGESIYPSSWKGTYIAGLGGSSASTKFLASGTKADTWYTQTLVSSYDSATDTNTFKSYNGTTLIETQDSTYKYTSAKGNLIKIVLQNGKKEVQGWEASYDDINVYTPSSAFYAEVENASSSAIEGLVLKFSSPVDPATVSGITITPAGGTPVAATAAVSDDLKTVTLTHDLLDYGTNYTIGLTSVRDLFGAAAADVAITTQQAPIYSAGPDTFDSFNAASGTTMPEGYSWIRSTGAQTQSATETNGNKYLRFWANLGQNAVGESSFGRSMASNSGNFVFRFRFMNENPAEFAETYPSTNQEQPIAYLKFSNGTTTARQQIRWKAYDDGRILFALGGCSSSVINSMVSGYGVTLQKLDNNKWIDFVFVSQVIDSSTQRFSFYVNGVFQGQMDNVLGDSAITVTRDAPYKLTDISLAMQKTQDYSANAYLGYDDIALYNTDRSLDIVSKPSAVELTSTTLKPSFDFEFTAPVSHNSLDKFKIIKADDTVVESTASYIDGDMDRVRVTPAGALDYGTSYKVKLDAVTALTGKSVSDELTFTTKQLLNGEEGGQHNLIIIGDSTAAKVPQSSKPWQIGWGEYIGKFLDSDIKVLNRARGGAKAWSYWNGTSDAELNWEKTSALINENDYVLIQFGHNDRRELDETVATTWEGTFEYYMRKLIDGVIAKGGVPILATPSETEQANFTYIADSNREKCCVIIENLAAEYGCAFLDMNDVSRDYYNALKTSGNTAELERYLDDGIHFTPYGAYTFASLVANEILASESNLKNHMSSVGKTDGLFCKTADGIAADFTAQGTSAIFFTKGAFAADVLAGAYDSNVNLLSCGINKGVSKSAANFTPVVVEFDVDEACAQYKLFVWENLVTLKPIFAAQSVENQ